MHGAGFANYLQSLFTGSIVLPLFGFNLGIELGQVLVLAAAGVALAALDRAFSLLRWPSVSLTAYRVRVVTVSLAVVAIAAEMAAARVPW